MKNISLILLQLLLLIGLVWTDDLLDKFAHEENVLVLKSDNFDDALKLDYVLVEFYAPWCGHCKALAPEYASAALQLKNEGKNIYLAKVDATQETELSERYEVRGYPTIKFFRKGTPIDYTGGRMADEIIKWLNKKTGPAATTLSSVSDAKKFTEASSVSIIGFFSNLESDEAKAYLDAAAELDEYQFGIVSEKEIFDEFKITKDSVSLFKNFDEKRNDLVENINKQQIKKFILFNSLPLVVEFNQQTAHKIFNGDIKAHNLLFNSKSSPESEKIIEDFRTVAKQYKGKVLFVTVNSDIDEHDRILEFFAIKKTDIPEMRLIKLEEEMTRFKPLTKDLTLEAIKSFVDGVLDGSIKQHLLSQILPEDWDKKPVKVLVSSNFDQIAFDKTKDVLVEFYAPWCGHCKKLEPIYNELAEKFASNDKVVIAKIDATANELEHIKINGFPTIKLFKKETNEVIEYNGERTLEGLNKFLETDGEYGKAASDHEEEEEEEEEEGEGEKEKAEDVGMKKDEL